MRVLIADYLHPFLAEQLVQMKYDVDIREDITNGQLLEVIGNYDGLVHSTRIHVIRQLIDKAERLKFIARAGSGLDNIDVAYAQSKHIAVISAPEANANAVAEHALGMLLSLLNNIVKADHEMRNGIWQREANRGYELDGRTVGIIGFGNNGSAFAKKLGGFDVRILAFDKYKTEFGTSRVEEVELGQLLDEAEVISFHVPLTAETKYYFDARFAERCRKNFWLINTSRGKVVNTADLIAALGSGKVRGAALDVFENEKLHQQDATELDQMEALKAMPNTVLTPHVAGWTHESYFKISKILAEKISNLHF